MEYNLLCSWLPQIEPQLTAILIVFAQDTERDMTGATDNDYVVVVHNIYTYSM